MLSLLMQVYVSLIPRLHSLFTVVHEHVIMRTVAGKPGDEAKSMCYNPINHTMFITRDGVKMANKQLQLDLPL